MTAFTIYDSQVTRLPGFDLAWLPPQAVSYVTPHIYHDLTGQQSIALEAGPYVGALPLTTGDTLYIAPRIGRQALARMLVVTERLTDAARKEFEEFASLSQGEDDNLSWIYLLSRSFLTQLRLIEKSSLRSERVQTTERRQNAKGKILVAPTLMSLIRREDEPVHCTYRGKTFDTAEHRVLAAAAATLQELQVVDEVHQDVSLRWREKLHGKPLTDQELGSVVRSLNSGYYTGARAYYIPALVMARLILVQGGLAFDDEDAIRTEALLTNVYALFESYVRITLRNALAEQGYVVEKLESGAPTLFADGTAELKPDVIISDARGVRLLVDVKYKLNEAIQAADYYQMAAYLKGYQIEHGLIVRPRISTISNPLVSRRMNYGGYVHELNIGLHDWTQAEEALVAGIKQGLAA